MSTTPEAVYDRISTIVDAVTGVAGDGMALENEQTPWTRTNRTFRLIPLGSVPLDLGNLREGHEWREQELIVRLSHKMRTKAQDTSRAQAETDALGVWRALVSDTTLRALCPLGVRVEIVGPALSESGDLITTDLTCTLGIKVATA